MKRIFVFFLLVYASHVSAIDELGNLRASYENAIIKVTAPVKATYEKELQKLLERYTKAGNLDEAAKVIAELKNVGATVTTSALSASKTGNQAPASPLSSERFFVNKAWKTPTGTKFSFEKGGTGKRSFGKDETSFVWRTLADGSIEVTGENTKGADMKTWLFRFVSSNEAYYGDNKDNLGAKLERQ
jgi:hypothetical protein